MSKLKELRELATDLGLEGINELNEQELDEEIQFAKTVEKERQDFEMLLYEQSKLEGRPVRKGKKDYVENAESGLLVAFRIGNKITTGKIKQNLQNYYIIETIKGSKLKVNKENILWVKTGQRWPNHIYNALKGKEVLLNG